VPVIPKASHGTSVGKPKEKMANPSLHGKNATKMELVPFFKQISMTIPRCVLSPLQTIPKNTVLFRR